MKKILPWVLGAGVVLLVLSRRKAPAEVAKTTPPVKAPPVQTPPVQTPADQEPAPAPPPPISPDVPGSTPSRLPADLAAKVTSALDVTTFPAPTPAELLALASQIEPYGFSGQVSALRKRAADLS